MQTLRSHTVFTPRTSSVSSDSRSILRRPLPTRVSRALLLASLDVSRTTVSNPADMLPQTQMLSHIIDTHVSFQPHSSRLHSLLLNSTPCADVARFRRARQSSHNVFPRSLPLSLQNLFLECVALLHPNTIPALHLHLTLHGRLVLQATVFADATIKHNIVHLATFLNPLVALLQTLPTDEGVHADLALFVFLVQGEHANISAFDRARARLYLRLCELDAKALRIRSDVTCVVESVFSNDTAAQGDIRLLLHDWRPLGDEIHAIRKMAMKKGKWKVAQTFREGTGRAIQAIIITEHQWMTPKANQVKVTCDNVKQLDCQGMRIVEVKLAAFTKWDWLVLRELLMTGVGLALLVFRFHTLDGLGRDVGRSKAITDWFRDIGEEKGRVVYVDCGDGGRNMEVEQVVVERRMVKPSVNDVMTEGQLGDMGVVKMIRERVGKLKSVVHQSIQGEGRPHVERIVHALNGEIGREEATRESERLMKRIRGLKSKVSTNVKIGRKEREVVVQRGDMTGYSPTGNKGLIPEGEYKGFAKNGRVPFTCDVRIQLKGGNMEDELEVGWFSRKWKIVEKMAQKVENGELLLSVVNEKTTLLKGGEENYVIATRVDVEGGGLEDYWRGELVGHGIKALESAEGADKVGCCVVELVPGLRDINQAYNGMH